MHGRSLRNWYESIDPCGLPVTVHVKRGFWYHWWCHYCKEGVDLEPVLRFESPVSDWFNKGLSNSYKCGGKKTEEHMQNKCVLLDRFGNWKQQMWTFFVHNFHRFGLSLCKPFTEAIMKAVGNLFWSTVRLAWSVKYLKRAKCCLTTVGTQLHGKMENVREEMETSWFLCVLVNLRCIFWNI